MDQALTNIAEQEVLPNNRQAFRAMAQPFKQKLSEIAQQNDLVDKSAEVKRLKREFSKRVQRFKENQKKLKKSREELEGKGYTPQQRRALEARLQEQANINVQDGRLQGGLTQKQMFGEAKTPDEVLSDLNFKQTITQELTETPGDTITETRFKGVRPGRIEQEALRQLGFQKTENGELQRIQSPRDPGLANWMEAERERIRRTSPDLSEEEVQNRVKNRLRSSVRGAVNRLKQGGVQTNIKGNPDDDSGRSTSGGPGSKEGIVQFGGRQVSLSEVPRGSDSDTRSMMKGMVRQLKNRYFKSRPDGEGALGRSEYQEYQKMKSEIKGEAAPDSSISLGEGTAGIVGSESFKQKVNDRWKEGAYTVFQNMEEDLQQMEEMTIDQQFIGINQSQESNRMERALDTAIDDPSTLKIPKLSGDQWAKGYLGGSSAAEVKREVVNASDPVAISQNGDMIKMKYRGSDGGHVDNMTAGETYFIEAPGGVRDAVKDESILGEDVSQIVEKNQRLEGVQLDNNWKEIGTGSGVQMRVQAQGDPVSGNFEPRYEVRSNNQSLSYGKAAKDVANSNKSRDAKIADLKQIARTANNNGIRMTVGDLREFLAADQKDLSEREQAVLDQNIRFQNRGIALEWGQKFRSNTNY